MISDKWYSIDGIGKDDSPAINAGVRELVPDGEHEVEIDKQENKSDRISLRLSDVEHRYGFVFLDFYEKKPDGTPNTKTPARMASLAAALGMTAGEWESAVDGGDLVGRRFIAKTRQWQQGERTRVEVDAFLPAPKPEPVKKSPPRTAGEKAMAKSMDGNDDIPF
jgi:hypothetical protein